MASRRKVKIFGELRNALQDTLAFEQGERLDLRVTELPPRAKKIAPREIRQIRFALRASQPVFAELLNVSTNTVQSWEQGVRRPRHAALKLLAIARKNPKALLEA